ncbi:MAG: thioesterase family protein [Cyanobacteria bacterium J06626_18]
MVFKYCRTIRFQDTDAAGVVYFARVLSICHEAYESFLQQAGVDVKTFFSPGAIAVPITHTEADFRRPLKCGDIVTIQCTPQQTSPSSFEIQYTLVDKDKQVAATASTRHVCIDTTTRQRCQLAPELTEWLEQWGIAAEVVAPPRRPEPSD